MFVKPATLPARIGSWSGASRGTSGHPGGTKRRYAGDSDRQLVPGTLIRVEVIGKTPQSLCCRAEDWRLAPMTPNTLREALAVLAEVRSMSPEVRLGQLLAHLEFLGEAHLGEASAKLTTMNSPPSCIAIGRNSRLGQAALLTRFPSAQGARHWCPVVQRSSNRQRRKRLRPLSSRDILNLRSVTTADFLPTHLPHRIAAGSSRPASSLSGTCRQEPLSSIATTLIWCHQSSPKSNQ